MSGPGLNAAQASQLATAFKLLREGRFTQALAIAEALAREAPFVSDAQQLLGMARSGTGDQRGAEQAFRAAIAISPRNEPLLLNFATWLAAHAGPASARDLLVAARASGPVLTQLGLLHLQLGEYAQAKRAFEHALQSDPTSPVAWHGLGNAFRALDDIDAAIGAYREATQLSPNAPNA